MYYLLYYLICFIIYSSHILTSPNWGLTGKFFMYSHFFHWWSPIVFLHQHIIEKRAVNSFLRENKNLKLYIFEKLVQVCFNVIKKIKKVIKVWLALALIYKKRKYNTVTKTSKMEHPIHYTLIVKLLDTLLFPFHLKVVFVSSIHYSAITLRIAGIPRSSIMFKLPIYYFSLALCFHSTRIFCICLFVSFILIISSLTPQCAALHTTGKTAGIYRKCYASG